jgi:hypothetical protein
MKTVELDLEAVPGPKKYLRRVGTRAAIWAAVVLLGTLAWHLGYRTYQAHSLPKAVHALLQEASARLSDALASTVDGTAGEADVAQRLDQYAIVADQLVTKLRDLDAAPMPELSAAADDYLITAREILRRRAAAYRYHAQLSERMGALRTHMRSDNRSAGWVSQAVRIKAEVDAEFRRYRLTATALSDLLGQYESSRTRVRPYLPASGTLMDRTMADAARARLTDALAQATEEVERASQLSSYR